MPLSKTDRRELPAYTIPEAAACAGLPLSTLRSWVSGRAYTVEQRVRRSRRLIKPASDRPQLLSFANLVEVFVLAAVRRYHGVPLQRVRKALTHVQRHMGISRPLIHAKFETDGLDLFVRRPP